MRLSLVSLLVTPRTPGVVALDYDTTRSLETKAHCRPLHVWASGAANVLHGKRDFISDKHSFTFLAS